MRMREGDVFWGAASPGVLPFDPGLPGRSRGTETTARCGFLIWLMLSVVLGGCKAEALDRGNKGDPQTTSSEPPGSAASEGARSVGARGSAATDSSSFWERDYDPGASPTPADGWHYAGTDCASCHTSGEWGFVVGGTVYQRGGKQGAAHIEVGVRDGAGIRTAYAGANGNFWISDSGTPIDWSQAQVRIRSAQGEAVMRPAEPRNTRGSTSLGACNKCHRGTSVLIGP